MEERAVGGKEKKYVLYTVVGEEKVRAGAGVWMMRIFLGTLLLVALAVVPYVSLRLAQVNDRTLVVFQQLPSHNRSKGHRNSHESRTSVHYNHVKSSGVSAVHILEAASQVKDNSTTQVPKTNRTSKIGQNSTLITLGESSVTMSLLEDTSNLTKVAAKNISYGEKQVLYEESDEIQSISDINVTSILTTTSTNEESVDNSSTPAKAGATNNEVVVTNSETVATTKDEETKLEISVTPSTEKGSTTSSSTVHLTTEISTDSEVVEEASPKPEIKPIALKMSSTLTTVITTSKPSTTESLSKATARKELVHKLAYVAVASSGNHVGGFCVLKTNKNVTKWSFFYENIPIEYQSHQDNTDHEMRGMLVAIRMWSPWWQDYHVVLRSHHQAIKESKHPSRESLVEELDQKSTNHFTYETEWRLRKDDTLVAIAYSLARLHKDYDYWFKDFQKSVDGLIGPQDWAVMKNKNRIKVPQEAFATKITPETVEKLGDLRSLSSY